MWSEERGELVSYCATRYVSPVAGLCSSQNGQRKKKRSYSGRRKGNQHEEEKEVAIGNCPFYPRCRVLLLFRYVKGDKEGECQLFGRDGVVVWWAYMRTGERGSSMRRTTKRRAGRCISRGGCADSWIFSARSGPTEAVGTARYGLGTYLQLSAPGKRRAGLAWWGLAVRRPT